MRLGQIDVSGMFFALWLTPINMLSTLDKWQKTSTHTLKPNIISIDSDKLTIYHINDLALTLRINTCLSNFSQKITYH